MKNNLVLISQNHQLISKIQGSGVKYIEVDPTAIFELDALDFESVDTVFDLTCFDRDTKCDLLDKIEQFFEGELITDLTINWVEYFLEHYPSINATLASAFYSPKDTYEIFAKEEASLNEAITFFKAMGLELESVRAPKIAFTYPRVISMIINEAYFSKEENLASVEDIDTAMKYGVNYPLGPFEWANKIGHSLVTLVLDELYAITGDPRYRVSRLLRIKG